MKRNELLNWMPSIEAEFDRRGLDTYAMAVSRATEMLQRDGEAIAKLAEHLDCMIDYVCESNAWRMVGAQNAIREARAALEAERDQLLYSERLHAEALGTAVQEAESLRSERDQLRAERDQLAEELVEARKPDCRTCARLIREADGPICSRAWVTRDICVDGNHYEYQPSLVRLYENAALAGEGEKP